MKSEFIRVFAFHADPVVGDQFPSGFPPFRTAEHLPIPDLLAAQFFMGVELADGPMGAVFDRLGHGIHASGNGGLVKEGVF